MLVVEIVGCENFTYICFHSQNWSSLYWLS